MLRFIVLLSVILTCQTTIAQPSTLPILSGVGGEFSAINSENKTMKLSDYQDKVVVVSFGYTNCADVCPFTLGYLTRLYGKLSDTEKAKVKFVFVTVNPEYDTPAHLKEFMAHFHTDFVGLTGTREQIDHIQSLFQVTVTKLSSVKIPTKNIRRVNPKQFTKKSDYDQDTSALFSHSIALYLMDKNGLTRSLEYTGTPVKEFITKIQELIHEK